MDFSLTDRSMNVNYHDKSKKHLLVEETCEDVPLRSGKWTHEEERYAASLIEHFESGKLTDCEEGETLRAYLSRKLHCIPMRVSKKYAGQCIGKHTFRVAHDATKYIPVLAAMRDDFLKSVHRKVSKNREGASAGYLLDDAMNSDFEQYLDATDAANSESSSDEDAEEEGRCHHPLMHSFSFLDVKDGEEQEQSETSFFGGGPIPSISNKQDSFEWVEVLSDNIDQL